MVGILRWLRVKVYAGFVDLVDLVDLVGCHRSQRIGHTFSCLHPTPTLRSPPLPLLGSRPSTRHPVASPLSLGRSVLSRMPSHQVQSGGTSFLSDPVGTALPSSPLRTIALLALAGWLPSRSRAARRAASPNRAGTGVEPRPPRLRQFKFKRTCLRQAARRPRLRRWRRWRFGIRMLR